VKQPVDILILSNGPGEVTTWVKPVVRELRRQLGEDRDHVRISLVLSPCTNASGQEAAIARRYPEIDRVQAAEQFLPFLLWGRTEQQWDWRPQGVVLFLGGDQFFPVVIGKRLGYWIVVYAEWEARWHRWVDRFGVMNSTIVAHASAACAHKFAVVGDLMAEAGGEKREVRGDGKMGRRGDGETDLIGLLPGSKAAKLVVGVPFELAIAERIHAARPNTRFVAIVAPTLDVQTLAGFADPAQNPLIQTLGWTGAELVQAEAPDTGLPYLKTSAGLQIDLWTSSPAYDLLSRCQLCLTTVGANTAELGALAVPMLVLLPTQQVSHLRVWDGLPGLLANLPGLGGIVATLMTRIALQRRGQLAWPNIWAKQEIVPELAGNLQPDAVAAIALDLLQYPEKLEQIRDRLRSVRGQPGAATKLVDLVREALIEQ
jgi:lipid-A-disaccharide synthase